MSMISAFKPSVANDAAAKRRLLFSDVCCFLAFGGGAGLSPLAPGTAGTLLAVPLYYAAAMLPPLAVLALAVLLLAAGVPICARAGRRLQHHDDGAVVWDEMASFFAVLALIPDDWRWQLAAFALFRLLDATKPFPIRLLDERVGGGWGVMLDDVAAAAATVAVVVAAAAFV